eukprot:scaffold272843_cov21-Tisochrysis_lutea.AAC.1
MTRRARDGDGGGGGADPLVVPEALDAPPNPRQGQRCARALPTADRREDHSSRHVGPAQRVHMHHDSQEQTRQLRP